MQNIISILWIISVVVPSLLVAFTLDEIKTIASILWIGLILWLKYFLIMFFNLTIFIISIYLILLLNVNSYENLTELNIDLDSTQGVESKTVNTQDLNVKSESKPLPRLLDESYWENESESAVVNIQDLNAGSEDKPLPRIYDESYWENEPQSTTEPDPYFDYHELNKRDLQARILEQERIQAEQERLQAEQERERAEEERIRAEQERERAEQERLRAEEERIRAEQERVKEDLEDYYTDIHLERNPRHEVDTYILGAHDKMYLSFELDQFKSYLNNAMQNLSDLDEQDKKDRAKVIAEQYYLDHVTHTDNPTFVQEQMQRVIIWQIEGQDWMDLNYHTPGTSEREEEDNPWPVDLDSYPPMKPVVFIHGHEPINHPTRFIAELSAQVAEQYQQDLVDNVRDILRRGE